MPVPQDDTEDVEALAREVETAELQLSRVRAGLRYARLLGAPVAVAPACAVMVLHESLDRRLRAMHLVLGALESR